MDATLVDQRDETKFALRSLVHRYPVPACAGGGRIQARVMAAMDAFQVERTKAHEANRRAVQAAFDVVVRKARRPRTPRPGKLSLQELMERKDERLDLARHIKLFRSMREHPELRFGLDWEAAYVETWKTHCLKKMTERKDKDDVLKEHLDPEFWQADARDNLGLVPTTNLIGVFFANEYARLADQHPERLRSTDDWWELAVVTLLAEDPDTPLQMLGIDADLRWGEWNKTGDGSIFADREGIRAFANADPEQGRVRELERREQLWALAARAARHLQDWESRRVAKRASADPEELVGAVPRSIPHEAESTKPSEDPTAGLLKISPASAASVELGWKGFREGGTPLRGWPKIFKALGEPNLRARKDTLKRMNTRSGGPITWDGAKPEVDRGELLAWIQDSEARAKAREDSRKANAAELSERNGLRAADHKHHIEKRPNARGRA